MVDYDEEKIIEIVYTNYKGETSKRRILPVKIWYGSTDWHKDKQWLLDAFDLGKDALRNFALKDISNWGEVG